MKSYLFTFATIILLLTIYEPATRLDFAKFDDDWMLLEHPLSHASSFDLNYFKKVFTTHPGKRSSVISVPKSNRAEDMLQYYKELGIKNPEKYMESQLQAIVLWAKVRKKFPEISSLDKSTKKNVLKRASKPVSKTKLYRLSAEVKN